MLSLDEEDRLARALRDGALDTINEAGQRIVQRQLEVPPTLTIRPGFPRPRDSSRATSFSRHPEADMDQAGELGPIPDKKPVKLTVGIARRAPIGTLIALWGNPRPRGPRAGAN